MNMKIKKSTTTYNPHFSLLWPRDTISSIQKTHHVDAQTYKNLELSYIISEIALLPQYQTEIEKTIRDLPVDSQVISYRQEILEDLKQNPEFITCIEELIPVFDLFTQTRIHKSDKNTEIFQLTMRLSELEGYIFCVQKLHKVCENLKHSFQSLGMKTLQAYVEDITRA